MYETERNSLKRARAVRDVPRHEDEQRDTEGGIQSRQQEVGERIASVTGVTDNVLLPSFFKASTACQAAMPTSILFRSMPEKFFWEEVYETKYDSLFGCQRICGLNWWKTIWKLAVIMLPEWWNLALKARI